MEISKFIFKRSAKQSHGIILSDLTLGIIGKISKHYKTKLLQRYFDERAPHRAVQLTSLFNVLVYIYQEQKHTIHKSQLSFTYRHAQQWMPNSDWHSQNTNIITLFFRLFGSVTPVVPLEKMNMSTRTSRMTMEGSQNLPKYSSFEGTGHPGHHLKLRRTRVPPSPLV